MTAARNTVTLNPSEARQYHDTGGAFMAWWAALVEENRVDQAVDIWEECPGCDGSGCTCGDRQCMSASPTWDEDHGHVSHDACPHCEAFGSLLVEHEVGLIRLKVIPQAEAIVVDGSCVQMTQDFGIWLRIRNGPGYSFFHMTELETGDSTPLGEWAYVRKDIADRYHDAQSGAEDL